MKLSSSTRKRPRNQRVSNPRQRKQQHLLDVKVRARKATQHRNRRVLVFVSKIALADAISAGIYFGARTGMRRFFFENPDYRLSTIEIQTDGTLQRDQVLKFAGLREGENIFQVNLAHVHGLQQLPQVDEVQVERKMPNEIDIRIPERKPIAWITSEKQSPIHFIRRGLSRRCARDPDEGKEIAPGISRTAPDHGLLERGARVWENGRFV